MTKRSQATLSLHINNTLALHTFARCRLLAVAVAVLFAGADAAAAFAAAGQDEGPATSQSEPKAKSKTVPADQDKSGQQPSKESAKTSESDQLKTPPPKPAPPSPRQTKLLDREFAKTWKLFAAEEGVRVQDVWKINKTESGNILVCTGKPKGYLRTQSELVDYTLSFEFRYPMDENGNSGVLLHIDGKDKIWPDGIQVQLHRPTAGSIFPSGNRKTRFTIGAKLELAVNKWNKCEIHVRKDTVEVKINDIAVGPMKYCNPARGYFALQSEGSEVHFRNMILTQYTPTPTPKPSVAKSGKAEPTSPKPSEEKPKADPAASENKTEAKGKGSGTESSDPAGADAQDAPSE